MKRFFSLLICMLALLSACGCAQAGAVSSAEESITEMLPVMYTLFQSIGVHGETPYNPSDPQFVWQQLWRMCAVLHRQDAQNGALIHLPKKEIQAMAEASFLDLDSLPPIPASEGSIGIANLIWLDDESGTYEILAFDLSDAANWSIDLEQWVLYDDGQVIATVSLYSAEEKLASMLFYLTPGSAGSGFPFRVRFAQIVPCMSGSVVEISNGSIRYPASSSSKSAASSKQTVKPASSVEKTPAPTPEANAEEVPETLKRGSEGEDVLKAQKRLKALGYCCVDLNGVYDSSMVRAIRFFQDAVDVRQDGNLDAALWKKLFSSDAPKFESFRPLEKGSYGIRVEDLQLRLMDLGYLAGPADGSYGSRTALGVTLFQQQEGIPADGKAGVETLTALFVKDALECPFCINLRKGDTGIRVKEMQTVLLKLGYLHKPPTGIYEDDTAQAVAAFQKEHGEDGDGRSASAELLTSLFYELVPAHAVDPVVTPEATSFGQILTTAHLEKLRSDLDRIQSGYGDEPLENSKMAVILLQTALGDVPVTGIYDQNTYNAVRLYKMNRMEGYNPLYLDGMPDPPVLNAVMKEYRADPSQKE